MLVYPMDALFDIGINGIVATPAALAVLEEAGTLPVELLGRHLKGDWGVVGEEDWATNDRAVQEGSRILSAYEVGHPARRVWIITDGVIDEQGNRYTTTILLPEDY